MKVIAKTVTHDDYGNETFTIEIDGKQKLRVHGGGEPEDNYLSRDLDFVYNIPGLMKLAYEAGKNGEEFEIKFIEEKDEDE